MSSLTARLADSLDSSLWRLAVSLQSQTTEKDDAKQSATDEYDLLFNI